MRILTAIPAYNEGEHLDEILTEVLRYTEEILVVDDGSKDRTPQILAAYPSVKVVRHATNKGYGAALNTMFSYTLDHGYEGLVTLDCDGQHEPKRIPELIQALADADLVSGSRYLKQFDPDQKPPEERRKINVEVTRWLNDCLGLNLTDAFCGFKAYRADTLRHFEITDFGYAMPLQVWVQAVEHGARIVEIPVPLIYLDEKRAFGGALDDASYRLKHYRNVFQEALKRSGLAVAEGCC